MQANRKNTSTAKCKIRSRLNTCARDECAGRCDVTNTPQTLPRSQKPLRIKSILCIVSKWTTLVQNVLSCLTTSVYHLCCKCLVSSMASTHFMDILHPTNSVSTALLSGQHSAPATCASREVNLSLCGLHKSLASSVFRQPVPVTFTAHPVTKPTTVEISPCISNLTPSMTCRNAPFFSWQVFQCVVFSSSFFRQWAVLSFTLPQLSHRPRPASSTHRLCIHTWFHFVSFVGSTAMPCSDLLLHHVATHSSSFILETTLPPRAS